MYIAQGRLLSGTGHTAMATNRLHHDVEVAQRATLGLVVGLVIAAFVALGAGAAIYDIGKALTIW